jgi:hypothetical protein
MGFGGNRVKRSRTMKRILTVLVSLMIAGLLFGCSDNPASGAADGSAEGGGTDKTLEGRVLLDNKDVTLIFAQGAWDDTTGWQHLDLIVKNKTKSAILIDFSPATTIGGVEIAPTFSPTDGESFARGKNSQIGRLAFPPDSPVMGRDLQDFHSVITIRLPDDPTGSIAEYDVDFNPSN